jgi:hypothetical protein
MKQVKTKSKPLPLRRSTVFGKDKPRSFMTSALSGPCNYGLCSIRLVQYLCRCICTSIYIYIYVCHLLACNMLHVINRPRTRAARGIVNVICAPNFQTENNALGRGGGTLGLPPRPCHRLFRALLPKRKLLCDNRIHNG